MNPEVSIITPLYNSENYIVYAIESVLKQTFDNWEMIIVDDCSSDDSSLKVTDYLIDSRVKLLHNKVNLGVALTRNKGIEAATGKYIAFLDADDIWAPEKLEEQVGFMKSYGYHFTYCAYQKIDSQQKVISQPIKVSPSVTYKQLLKNNEIGCLTAIYDAECLGKFYFIKVGHEDFAYWLQILKKNVTAYSINKPLAYYRVHNNTVSSNKLKAARYTWNIYRKVENINFFNSMYYFINYAVKALFKYLK